MPLSNVEISGRFGKDSKMYYRGTDSSGGEDI